MPGLSKSIRAHEVHPVHMTLSLISSGSTNLFFKQNLMHQTLELSPDKKKTLELS